MSLRYAVLGLLAERPASGYELAQMFEQSLQRWAWYARHSQIYPELNKLAEEGVITVAEEGARGRRTYALADSGRAELREWLLKTPETPVVRDESTLRLFLLPTLDTADRRRLVEYARAEAEQLGAEIEVIIERLDGWRTPERPITFGRLAAEYGRLAYQAQREWADWALERMDKPARG
ncbi:PadR family transcriptional regulator [Fodinicola acaciae]|uniref:PadR family transcriptional regulator n=1 Tax=Fodinicola acaciae TaxID=2681555 RepID=UPI0013D3441B|nr:PadR family transcriptional regulator [Fodinicola acaciae]